MSQLIATPPARLPHRLAAVGVALLVLVGVPLAAGSPAAAAATATCKESSYIPGLTPLMLRHPTGVTVHFLKNSNTSVSIWINSIPMGAFAPPLTLTPELQIVMRGKWVTETWLGSVRSVWKYQPQIRACGAWAANTLP